MFGTESEKLHYEDPTLPQPQLDFGIGEDIAHAQAHTLDRIRRANERYQLAAAAVISLNEQLTKARLEKEHAWREVRDLMQGRTRVVIGKTLITCHANGHVQIENVEVLK